MGADKAVHVVDDALHGSDALATSLVLAKALEQAGDVDLVLLRHGVHRRPDERDAGDAGRAARPAAADRSPRRSTVDGDHGDDRAATDDGYRGRRGARLPAVVSVVEKINEPRYPSFKGIMAAKKKPVETSSLADLGVDAGEVGLRAALDAGRVVEAAPAARRPARSSTTRATAAPTSWPSSSRRKKFI